MTAVDKTFLANLDPRRSVYTVLGILCHKPQIVRNQEMPLNEGDFFHKFHKNIFAAINNIAYSDATIEKVTAVDIDNYLAQYPANYKIWEQHNGFDFIQNAIDNVNIKTYKNNYWRLKKFAMLRDYVEQGMDVTSLYDYRVEDLALQEEQMRALDKMTIDNMIEHFSLKMIQLRDKWQIGDNKKSFMAGEGMAGLLDRLRETPEFGYPFRNGYYNALFRGMRFKKFMLRSAGTGVGKTRHSIADLAGIACSHIWDYETKSYISNGPTHPVLFISTELEKEELQTGMLAHISGVDEDVIKNGGYSSDIQKRLEKGIEIIAAAPYYVVYIDDFSINDIETIIEQHIIEHDVKYIGFDYIQMVPKLARTMQEAFAGALREDQILVQLSAALKLLSNKYDVYVISATQLNRNSKDHEMRDTSSLRGGSATADKVDHGVMMFRTTQKDLENLKHILERGYHVEKPNFCHYVYKNRGGRTGIIIWTKYHGATIREEPLFLTDMDYNHIADIQQVKVLFNDEVPKTIHEKFVEKRDTEAIEEFGEDGIPEF
jgi:replicative DNA helicase